MIDWERVKEIERAARAVDDPLPSRHESDIAREDVPWLCERLRELARALSRSVPHPDDVALVASLPDEFLSPSEEKAGG